MLFSTTDADCKHEPERHSTPAAGQTITLTCLQNSFMKA